MKTIRSMAAIGICVLALAGCAKADPNSPAGKRHAAFEQIGDAKKALEGIFEGAAPDMTAVGAQVAILKAQTAVLPSLFPAGTGPGSDQPTEALADIWTKPAEFAKEMDGLKATVAALDAAVTKGDTAAARTAATDFGKTCKSCHSKFKES